MLRNWYAQQKKRMTEAGIESAGFELDLLLAQFADISRERRLLCPDTGLDDPVRQRLDGLITRRLQGEPLQYLLGQWEFFGRSFSVGPGVLIPRADTEILVEQALSVLEKIPSPKIADLCAGSGCIGITVACERPDAAVSLVELSEQAAVWCRKNIDALAPQCCLLQADVLNSTAGLEDLDAVLSNPPYIPTKDLSGLQKEVQNEPFMALDGDTDGLRFYRGITGLWKKRIRPGGWMIYEIGFDQAEDVSRILAEHGFKKVRTIKDYGGNDRVVLGQKQ
ncbi:MAG: peptide chain release factor N(5)-glutamine methyltransferase [Oscillospiraceae bacterium]|nr:peptide chain release factor N(5)-glutamine methyltransferase [Oscillospiraceae bacterium]